MKKNIVLFIVIIVLGASCNRSNTASSSSYYINATVAGTSMSFNGNMVGTLTTVANQTILEISGFSGGSAGQNLSITLNNQGSDSAFVARTYTDAPSAFNVLALYGNLPTGFAAGTSVENGARTSGVTIRNPFRFVITAIDGQHVQGTFSGDFYQGGDPTQANIESITNGSFDVKLN